MHHHLPRLSHPTLANRSNLPTALALLSIAISSISLTVEAATPAPGNAAPHAGAEQQIQYPFNIPQQSLASSLSALARTVNVQLSLEAGLVEGRLAPALIGTYSLSQAMQVLLGSTAIDWKLTPQRNLILVRRNDSATLNLDATTISGSQDLEAADGPVDGYRATRTATATKTDTALRDVPQSIQVIPRQLLEDQKATRLNDALSNVSSVQPSSSRGGATDTFVVRGFRATSYAVDGVMTNPLAERPEVQRDLGNIERVEVLKGPASVLYGRGDPGGLINMVTRRPTFEPEGSVQLEAGSYDFYRLGGDVSGALNPQKTLAGRLTLATQTDGGFRNTYRNSERTFIAPSLLWQVSEDTRVNLDLEYTHQSGQFDRGLVATNGKVNLPADQFLGEPFSQQTASKTAATLRVEHDLNDWLTLRQVVRVDDSHNDRYSVDPRSLRADNRTLTRRVTDSTEDIHTLDSQTEAVAHLQTGSLNHTLLAGFEYVHGRLEVNADRSNIANIDIYNPVYGAQPTGFNFNNRANNKVDLYSVYLQDQVDLSERWKLLIGARYDKTRQLNETTDEDFQVSRQAIDSEKVTPRLGVVFQPLDWISLYASYSTSFRPQTSVTQSGNVLDPETGVQYEIGSKLELIPDRLSATLAAFELTRKNVAATDPNDIDFSVQTGEQRVRGLELDVTGSPLPGWRIIGNASLLDAQVTQDTVIKEGNRLTGVPRLSGALWSTYQLQDGAFKGLGVGAGVITVGKRQGDLQNSFDVSGYTRLDASVFYDIDEQTRIALNGRNLSGRKYIETVSESTEVYAGAPTQVVASLIVKF
ncbi:TonB-dependent siderophore receptor [Pseudomonas syringae]|uniref:TonB-dependent siderophore receptor n=1 Tax=Pseudomonas syringae TaxID=317 RepID=UPI003F759C1F